MCSLFSLLLDVFKQKFGDFCPWNSLMEYYFSGSDCLQQQNTQVSIPLHSFSAFWSEVLCL